MGSNPIIPATYGIMQSMAKHHKGFDYEDGHCLECGDGIRNPYHHVPKGTKCVCSNPLCDNWEYAIDLNACPPEEDYYLYHY